MNSRQPTLLPRDSALLYPQLQSPLYRSSKWHRRRPLIACAFSSPTPAAMRPFAASISPATGLFRLLRQRFGRFSASWMQASPAFCNISTHVSRSAWRIRCSLRRRLCRADGGFGVGCEGDSGREKQPADLELHRQKREMNIHGVSGQSCITAVTLTASRKVGRR